MPTTARRRAIRFTALMWAVVWAVLSVVLVPAALLWVPQIRAIVPTESVLGGVAFSLGALALGALSLAIKGALTGAAFALLLGRMERGRRAEALSGGRLLLWANAIGALWSVAGLAALLAVDPTHQFLALQLTISLVGHAVLVTVSALVTIWLLHRPERGDADGGYARPDPALLSEPLPLPLGERTAADARIPDAQRARR